MKTLWCITIFASLVFIIQSVMTFIGMDSDTGMDLDVDSNASDSGEPFQLYTFRNFINLFSRIRLDGNHLAPVYRQYVSADTSFPGGRCVIGRRGDVSVQMVKRYEAIGQYRSRLGR